MDKDIDIEVAAGNGGAKMIEEINKVLTEQSAAPLTPEELEKYKSQFAEYLKLLKSEPPHNGVKSRLTIGQKKKHKAKRRISNKSRKINQEKNRHNKFTK